MKDITFTREQIAGIRDKVNVNAFEQYTPEWINMTDVEAKTQPWFWPRIIPSDAITLFGGTGGIGKSLLLLYLIAKTTTGESFDAGGISHRLPQGDCILLSAEDDLEYHIKPKLIAANADTDKIHLIKSKIGSISKRKKFLELDKDLAILESKIIELGDVRSIIIDPIAYFIGDVRDNYSADVANFLQEISDLAKKHHLATILNKHLRKKSSNASSVSSAVDEVGGAGAWTNTPRRCWLITNDHEDHNIKIISKMKDNLGKEEEDCLAYKICPVTLPDSNIQTTQLVWLDKMIKITADEAVNKERNDKTKHEQAIDYFFSYLKEYGQSSLKSIQEAAIKSGIKERTFERAHEEIRAKYLYRLIQSKGMDKRSIFYQINSAY